MMSGFWKAVVFLILFCSPALSVKDYLFKKCEQNGFCHRNRHYANQITTFEGQYEPRYSVEKSQLNYDEEAGLLRCVILKQLESGEYVDFDLTLSVVEDYNLRVQVDETNRENKISNSIIPNPHRYNETGTWAFKGMLGLKQFEYSTNDDQIVLQYGEKSEYKAILETYPLRIRVLYKEVEQIVLNDRDFLNMEHYRTEDEIANKIGVLPEESTFNAYKDDFKDSKGDELPLGPESVALDFTFVNFTHVYGIPEHADSLSLKDTSNSEPYRLYNVDIFEYEVQSKLSMYGSIPLMIAVKSDVSAGVFWVNAADTYIDISKHVHDVSAEKADLIWADDEVNKVQTHWMSENGIIDVILIVKPTANEINKAYGEITGFSTLPNIFSLGYHQCRWNYNDEADVLEVHDNFDKYEIPYDTIWLDIEYTDNKKYFTWNKALFPDPDKMMSILDETKRQLVVIVDPHIKDGYPVSEEIDRKKIGIKDINADKTYHGHCWPGDSVWIDTLNPLAQSYWDQHFENGTELLGNSVNGHLWNDMNEPSVFNGPETTAPKDLIHFGDYEHRSIHNIYGLTFHESTYHALIERNPEQRPFILTRSFFAGSQRTCAMWTGDNMAKWEYLKESIPMVLTMNIVGFAFAGADVGGFFGNPSKELLVRWYQTGIWYPFFRGHAHIDSRRREPWIAGGEYTDHMRDAIQLRYQLLPSLYTEFWKNSIGGTPIMKPLLWEVPNDENVYEIDNEFYFGGLLVHPIVEEGASEVEVYFPCDGESYYDFFDFNKRFDSCQYISVQAELGTIPVYAKGGSIITTRDRYRRSAQLMKYDPFTLYVIIGADGKAHGDLYIDDGESFGYNTGDSIHIIFEADEKDRTLKARVASIGDGEFVRNYKEKEVSVNKIVIVGSKPCKEIHVKQGSHSGTAECIHDVSTGGYVIRNPKVLITKDWTIEY